MKHLFFITFNFLFLCSNIEVRVVKKNELEEVLELDRRVIFEYFKPLYKKFYSHLPIGQNPDYFLEKDLELDTQNFKNYLEQDSGYDFLRVAYDVKNIKIVGIINFHFTQKNIIEIDLLIVDKVCRGQGVGKKLVNSLIKDFQDLQKIIVMPYQLGNEKTLNFYYSLGFKNLGLPGDEKDFTYNIEKSKLYYLLELDIKNLKRSFYCQSDDDGLIR